MDNPSHREVWRSRCQGHLRDEFVCPKRSIRSQTGITSNQPTITAVDHYRFVRFVVVWATFTTTVGQLDHEVGVGCDEDQRHPGDGMTGGCDSLTLV